MFFLNGVISCKPVVCFHLLAQFFGDVAKVPKQLTGQALD